MKTRFTRRSFDAGIANKLTAAGIPSALSRALAARNVTEASDLAREWTSMIPPTLLSGTREAAQILADARERGQLVTVVGDYDCDGATACAIAVRGLSLLGIRVNYFVPDRFQHGYGLSPTIVDTLFCARSRPDVLLTVDNGIASLEAVAKARALGMRVIVTDHHLPADSLPEADCIVNPNQPGCAFPSKVLAGCGVMYYVLLALRARLRELGAYAPQTQPRLDTLSDLVALGTIADVVALDKNNRILVSQGLARIRSGRACPGINALLRIGGRDYMHCETQDLAFFVAPRINAAGRLSKIDTSIECLLAQTDEQAQHWAEQLEQLNIERRALEDEMLSQASEQLADLPLESQCTVTLFREDWHQGVVGLVSSRVKDKINRPVITFAPDDADMLRGSGRSVTGVHLRDALDRVDKANPGLIERFGGHAMAAGLTIRKDNLERFKLCFEESIGQIIEPTAYERVIETDGPLSPDEIHFPFVEMLSGQIWGQAFEQPVYENDFTVISQRILKNRHNKLLLDLDGVTFEAIYFRHSKPLPGRVRLAYRPEINEFAGRRSIQLKIEAMESES